MSGAPEIDIRADLVGRHAAALRALQCTQPRYAKTSGRGSTSHGAVRHSMMSSCRSMWLSHSGHVLLRSSHA